MSADLYTSKIDSDTYGDLFLEMVTCGKLRLVAIGPGNEGGASFQFPANPEGWKEAENLIGALQEWVRKTKELQNVPDGFPKCEKCLEGKIQHTSFMGEDENITHVYGCNRCSNGWSEDEKS